MDHWHDHHITRGSSVPSTPLPDMKNDPGKPPPARDPKILYRSSSASLITTYVPADDPTLGIDLGSSNKHTPPPVTNVKPPPQLQQTPTISPPQNYLPTKTVSCENISSLSDGKASFPHAFLRSRPPKTVIKKEPARRQSSEPRPSSLNLSEQHSKLFENVSQCNNEEILRRKLRAVSEENCAASLSLRRNQGTLKLRLSQQNPRQLYHRNRSYSATAINENSLSGSPPHSGTADDLENDVFKTSPQVLLDSVHHYTDNGISIYMSSTESGYESDSLRSEAKKLALRKLENDVDSGVSTGTHSEANSDTGSFTGSEHISYDNLQKDEVCHKPELAKTCHLSIPNDELYEKVMAEYYPDKSFSWNLKDKMNKCVDEVDGYTTMGKFSRQLSEIYLKENHQKNLTDEEKLVPNRMKNRRRSDPPPDTTSRRQQFLASQLDRQRSFQSSPCSSTPLSDKKPPPIESQDQSNSPWWDIGSPVSDGLRGTSLNRFVQESYSRPPLSLPVSLNQGSSSPNSRTYRLMRLLKDKSGELGIYITARKNSEGATTGYVIAHIEKGGLTDRFV